jgi:hypothetical protein
LDPNLEWSRNRIGIQQKMLDPDPHQMNTDPQHWQQAPEEEKKSAVCCAG